MKFTRRDVLHFAAAFVISFLFQIVFVAICLLILNTSGGHMSEYPVFPIVFEFYLWPIFYLPKSLAFVGHGANIFIAPLVGLLYSALIGLIYCAFRKHTR